ncbi:MAG: serine hydrolase [Chloroflexi bacterium]|nr:serine hydrolase [Chloroflexota bacterium]
MTTKFIDRLRGCCAVLCVLTVMLAGCSSLPVTVAPAGTSTPISDTGVYWPTAAWRTSPPEEQGMDSAKLAELLDAIRQQRLDLHSLLIIRNGYLVSETYFGSYQQDTRHVLYSCTKSFVATLVGIAIDHGYIDGTDHRIVDFFSERTFANLDGQKEEMTLEDVLTMQSGLDWQEGDPAYQAMYGSADWVKFMLDKPMAVPPGSQFNYCSGCSHLLSAIVQQTTGLNTRDFAEQYLFKPLGISNAEWETDAAGLPIGGWGLQLTPRDMAKLGYLYLQGGRWAGHQIISTEWIQTATHAHAQAEGNLDYGYQWWTQSSPIAYAALGRYGQTIFVVPQFDLVIVTTAQLDNHDAIFQLIDQYILPAVQTSP